MVANLTNVDSLLPLPINAQELANQLATSPFQAICDSIANTVSKVCECPMAIVTIRDHKQHVFLSSIGIEDIFAVSLKDSLCSHALINNRILEIRDASKDIRFESNPFVIGNPHIRFYAGVPIGSTMGEQVGTLSVLDIKAKQLNLPQSLALTGLADVLLKTIIAHGSTLRFADAS